MKKIVECVPNFSEGRDIGKISHIVDAAKSVKGVKLIDFHSDPDHNRSVLTLIGPPQAVSISVYKLTAKAAELIEIEKHSGVHPFIGAVDVIPFVPLKGVSMEEVVELARSLGDKIAHDLKIPVYLYGEAALRPDRRNLADVRRGGYERLNEEMGSATRHPDYGESKLHPQAGAVAIGVRDFLIAFNVNLETKDVTIAHEIAKNIREKHGGLPGVRAIGVFLKSRGIAQVSMNITEHRKTGLYDVMSFIKESADEMEVKIRNSEIIGLIPKDAVFPKMKEYLKLEDFSERKILNSYL